MNKQFYKVYSQRLVAFLILHNIKIKSVHYEEGRMAFVFNCDKDRYESVTREYNSITKQE